MKKVLFIGAFGGLCSCLPSPECAQNKRASVEIIAVFEQHIQDLERGVAILELYDLDTRAADSLLQRLECDLQKTRARHAEILRAECE